MPKILHPIPLTQYCDIMSTSVQLNVQTLHLEVAFLQVVVEKKLFNNLNRCFKLTLDGSLAGILINSLIVQVIFSSGSIQFPSYEEKLSTSSPFRSKNKLNLASCKNCTLNDEINKLYIIIVFVIANYNNHHFLRTNQSNKYCHE